MNSQPVYPPTKRRVNKDILKEFQKKPYTELNVGDHIKCHNLSDCILKSRQADVLTVIGCEAQKSSSNW